MRRLSASLQHLVLLTPKVPPAKDGVGDYTYYLGKELSETHKVSIVTTLGQRTEGDGDSFRVLPVVRRWNAWGMPSLWVQLKRLQPSLVNLQWVPFLWGKWGVNFALPLTVLRLKQAGYRVVTTVHEPYVAWGGVRRFPLALLQRVQLRILISASTKVTVTTRAWEEALRRAHPKRAGDIVWLPVGSNIPIPSVLPTERRLARQTFGLEEGELAIGTFSPLGSGKRFDFVTAAWRKLKERGVQVALLVIGATADEVQTRFGEIPVGDGVRYTGYLPPEDVSQHLLALDLALAPFDDGISCRRSSAIAAMAYGVPLVTTRGHLTDPVFEESPIVLIPANDHELFARAVADLAADPGKRDDLSRRTRAFFDQHFTWHIIAKKLLASIQTG
jgi:glycosyltransferase involved in cell wall biosynthesis